MSHRQPSSVDSSLPRFFEGEQRKAVRELVDYVNGGPFENISSQCVFKRSSGTVTGSGTLAVFVRFFAGFADFAMRYSFAADSGQTGSGVFQLDVPFPILGPLPSQSIPGYWSEGAGPVTPILGFARLRRIQFAGPSGQIHQTDPITFGAGDSIQVQGRIALDRIF